MTFSTVEERPSAAGGSPRSDSELSGEGCEDRSKLENHSFKRTEEPQRNEYGKFFCVYKECYDILFDRKCDWSKHMDKHDRPYDCKAKGCEKLRGFTYHGGLLRHKREVHKMHGGTKKSLFCPFPDCKRSSGGGFTRKENLAEHVRRVHRGISIPGDLHGPVIGRDMICHKMRAKIKRLRLENEKKDLEIKRMREENEKRAS